LENPPLSFSRHGRDGIGDLAADALPVRLVIRSCGRVDVGDRLENGRNQYPPGHSHQHDHVAHRPVLSLDGLAAFASIARPLLHRQHLDLAAFAGGRE